MSASQIFTPTVLIISGLMLVSGTINTIAFKYEGKYNYKHGLTMTMQMFVGEFLNLLILVLPLLLGCAKVNRHFRRLFSRAETEKKVVEVNYLRLSFGGFLDAFGSGLQTVALLIISPSVYQMMKNGGIIFAAFFTVHYLKKPLYRHNWLGVCVLLIGFVIVGLSSIIYGDSAEPGNNNVWLNILGVFMMFISLIFQGFQYCYEEKVLDEVEVDPKRMVAAEGVMGALTILFFSIITSYMPCNSDKMCDPEYGFDDPGAAMLHLTKDYRILIFALVSVFSITMFNVTGLYLTKYVSGIFRVIMDSVRTISVWILSVFFGFESLRLGSFILQIIGFGLLIIGNLIYNEIVIIRFFGFDKFLDKKKPNTDPKILEYERLESLADTDD